MHRGRPTDDTMRDLWLRVAFLVLLFGALVIYSVVV